MNNIFKYRNLGIPKPNQDTFGKKVLKSYGQKIWNALPYHKIKTSENLNCFKAIIKCWDALAESANIRLQDNRKKK